jgi:hypothetical protein
MKVTDGQLMICCPQIDIQITDQIIPLPNDLILIMSHYELTHHSGAIDGGASPDTRRTANTKVGVATAQGC